MKRCYFAALLLIMAGCAARKPPAPAPAIVAAPTAVAATPTPIIVVAPPLTFSTPTPDSAEAARRAVVSRELARLRNASPERDVEAAWANNDTKFVALLGAGWHIPGVPKNRVMALINKYNATPIEGMSDVVEIPQRPEDEELGRLALPYATRYNQLLLAKLDARNTAAPR